MHMWENLDLIMENVIQHNSLTSYMYLAAWNMFVIYGKIQIFFNTK